MFLQNSNSTGVLDNASKITDVVWESINSLATAIIARLPYLIAGTIVIVLFWLLSSLIRKIFMTTTKRTRLDERLRILFSRLIVVGVFILGVFTALTIVVPSFAFGDFIAGLGLTSLAIGFATKDILNHLISGVLILWQQPFRIGDFLILKDDEGRVESIGVRATSLKRANGEVILIPNGDIYSSAFRIRRAGATYPMSFKFHVGFDADIDESKRITRETLANTDMVTNEPPPKVVVTDLATEGVRITANFRINSHENRPLEAFDHAASRVVKALFDAGIEIYPPTSTILTVASPRNDGFGMPGRAGRDKGEGSETRLQ